MLSLGIAVCSRLAISPEAADKAELRVINRHHLSFETLVSSGAI